jgi:hypothetical protein
MKANNPEHQEQILVEMIKRERKYATKLKNQSDKVMHVHSERGNSPVSSATMTEIMESTHDPLRIRKGVCEWMYRVSRIGRYKCTFDFQDLFFQMVSFVHSMTTRHYFLIYRLWITTNLREM